MSNNYPSIGDIKLTPHLKFKHDNIDKFDLFKTDGSAFDEDENPILAKELGDIDVPEVLIKTSTARVGDISPNGEYLATEDTDDFIRIFNIKEGQLVLTQSIYAYTQRSNTRPSVCWITENRLLIGSGQSNSSHHGRAYVYDNIDGEFVLTQTIQGANRFSGNFGSEISTDGQFIAISESGNNLVYIYNLELSLLYTISDNVGASTYSFSNSTILIDGMLCCSSGSVSYVHCYDLGASSYTYLGDTSGLPTYCRNSPDGLICNRVLDNVNYFYEWNSITRSYSLIKQEPTDDFSEYMYSDLYPMLKYSDGVYVLTGKKFLLPSLSQLVLSHQDLSYRIVSDLVEGE